MNKLINGALQKISRYEKFPTVDWNTVGKSLMNVNTIGTSCERKIFGIQKTIRLNDGDPIPEKINHFELYMYDLTDVKNPNYYIEALKENENVFFCINLSKRYNIENMSDYYLINANINTTSTLDNLLFAELIKHDSLLYTNSI